MDAAEPRRIKWWAWVSTLAIGLFAAALGLGWFLVIAIGLTWGAVCLEIPWREPPHNAYAHNGS